MIAIHMERQSAGTERYRDVPRLWRREVELENRKRWRGKCGGRVEQKSGWRRVQAVISRVISGGFGRGGDGNWGSEEMGNPRANRGAQSRAAKCGRLRRDR